MKRTLSVRDAAACPGAPSPQYLFKIAKSADPPPYLHHDGFGWQIDIDHPDWTVMLIRRLAKAATGHKLNVPGQRTPHEPAAVRKLSDHPSSDFINYEFIPLLAASQLPDAPTLAELEDLYAAPRPTGFFVRFGGDDQTYIDVRCPAWTDFLADRRKAAAGEADR